MRVSAESFRALFVSVSMLAVPISAQTGLGVVRGVVQDSSEAAVPSARVTLTEATKGIAREAQTNASGIYYFGSVPIGQYSLVVEAAGFKKWDGRLEVQAGQTVTVDPSLQIGELQATVEVEAAAVAIATEGAQISDIKDAQRIHDLPLNGRQVSNLFTLTPGVEGGFNSQQRKQSTHERNDGRLDRDAVGWRFVRRSIRRWNLSCAAGARHDSGIPNRDGRVRRTVRSRPQQLRWSRAVAPMLFMARFSRRCEIMAVGWSLALVRTEILRPN